MLRSTRLCRSNSMAVLVALLGTALVCDVCRAQTTRPADQPFKGTLLDGVCNQTHPVSTQNAEAQKFFDQGLCLLYAFNHDEAMRSFARASEIDLVQFISMCGKDIDFFEDFKRRYRYAFDEYVVQVPGNLRTLALAESTVGPRRKLSRPVCQALRLSMNPSALLVCWVYDAFICLHCCAGVRPR